MYRTECIEWQ